MAAFLQPIMSRRALGVSLAVILIGISLSSARILRNPNRGPYDGNWERIQTTGVLVIGIDPSLPPFGQFEGEGVAGLDPSLGAALAAELGLEVRYVVLGFDGIYDTLLLGYADVIIAAMRPDPLRMDRIRYTAPYFDAGQIIVSRADYETWSDLERLTVGVEFASEGDLAARQHPTITLERFFTADEAIDAVIAGEIDAAVVDRVSAYLYQREQPEHSINLSVATLVPDPYVLAVRRTDWRLFQAVQAGLARLGQRGVLTDLVEAWMLTPSE